MTLAKLYLVLTMLAPRAGNYAKPIYKYSKMYGVDPLIATAVIWKESQFRRGLCARGDHGLMQIHLNPPSCKETMSDAREAGLYKPWKNIQMGVKMMAGWKSWVKKIDAKHHWLLNYNQGYGKCPRGRTRCSAEDRRPVQHGWAGGYDDRVMAIYSKLKGYELHINLQSSRGCLHK